VTEGRSTVDGPRGGHCGTQSTTITVASLLLDARIAELRSNLPF